MRAIINLTVTERAATGIDDGIAFDTPLDAFHIANANHGARYAPPSATYLVTVDVTDGAFRTGLLRPVAAPWNWRIDSGPISVDAISAPEAVRSFARAVAAERYVSQESPR